MGVNKVTLNTPNGEEIVVDFSNDTVTAETLLSGYTAHGADGEPITGTLEAGIDESILRSIIDRSITSITIPAGMTKIGTATFGYCTSLRNITWADTITEIADNAFWNAANAQIGTLPPNLVTIGAQAFEGIWGCWSGVTIPASVQTIGSRAFAFANNIPSFTFKGKPATIGSNAFWNTKSGLILNVPWAEGEVSGAPWGATNATINYNYTG